MTQKTVREIIRPYSEGTPLEPSVKLSDKITSAVEVMANHHMSRVAVVRNQQPVGVIRLEDAFQALGLQTRPPRRRLA